MQYHEWQTKYTRLLKTAEKLVHHMRRYDEFKAAADKRSRNAQASEIERLAEAERKKIESKQGELI